jgi:hypothetical protein
MRGCTTVLFAMAAAGCASVTGLSSDAGVETNTDMPPVYDFANSDLTLTCGIGFRLCVDHCVGPNECCMSSECTSPANGTGSCTKSQCTIQCNPGYALCGGMCIPGTGSCCSASDCPPLGNAMTTQCNMAMCSIQTCKPGFYNLDGKYDNGCECADTTAAKTCPTATSMGTVALGGTTSRVGVLPVAGGENWFQVAFAYTTAATYHPKVSLSAASGDLVVFDLHSNCTGGTLSCAVEGGASTTRTIWETTGGGSAGSLTFAPTPSVGSLFIRVRRANGTASCANYTLTVQN